MKLSKIKSLKSLENQQTETYERLTNKKMANYFTISEDRRQKYSEKSFQQIYTATNKKQRSPQQESFLNKFNYSNYCYLNSQQNEKPLDQILKGKQNKMRGISKQFKQKAIQNKYFTGKKPLKLNHYNESFKNKTAFKSQKRNQPSKKLQYHTATKNNISLNRCKNNTIHVNTLKNEKTQQKSRSRSSKRKGLECTLFQRSLEKCMNESNIKSNKKLISIKSKYEKIESQPQKFSQKEFKKILLRKKNPQNLTLNDSNCFQSVIFNKQKSNQKYQHSNSKQKRQCKLNSSTVLVKKQACKRPPSNSNSKSRQTQCRSLKKQFSSQALSGFDLKTYCESNTIPQKTKKITLNERIKESLDKIHLNYKFILNYLSDFEIISKLNGYELAKQEECKWILLLIDQVYDLIKHSEQTKLKGIEHSRQDYKHFI